MNLKDAMQISAAGMKAQGQRLRVISENLANADSTAQTPGGEPYRRKILTFKNVLNRSIGADMVQVNKIMPDSKDFELKYDPSHPAANAEGYVLRPNVNSLLELSDMRQAQRSYEANLSVIETSKAMLSRTIGLLRSA
ncbi:flagellar basal body rod protein FlgC [Elstera cyanobacteriorum]|uniref:Flagellar basal-body rod protein FlgC n=1 Tax=Elstera cyanobacteriorum TaxID=2022747 RepID=A0A255XPA3_9PROT|nr:flagellar basal body rod protein FlgC [Elstera cyanobacteriorum]MCK6442095.1 flagellar basal body rod protein FlgC [Elstera cyanobacteriorum]OYQ18732.1 flagellar basal body rod protein FlgC [Elstera cyanobacteriorum]GFZ78085.1 flagellar basal-body rod protein FlgC [Elstera cyanobacteriorum]